MIASALLGVVVLVANALPAAAYIPAVPVNDTSALNLTASSPFDLYWSHPTGTYGGFLSYQLSSDTNDGTTFSGAVVHFTEASAGIWGNVATPWIAWVSCDTNETNASMEDDIFTLARDRGAVAAILYSLTSSACLLNSEYIEYFDHVLDVFATSTLSTSQLYNSQFSQKTNSTFSTYNGTLLNTTSNDVNTTLTGTSLTHDSYLGGVILARNGSAVSGGTGTAPASTSSPTPAASNASGSTKSKGLIAAYVVAGFMSAMVCITVFSVVRRSLQPLEPTRGRYIPGGGMNQQTGPPRRVGLAKAIVDTFPIIKFNKPIHKDIGSQSDLGIALPDLSRPGPASSTLTRELESGPPSTLGLSPPISPRSSALIAEPDVRDDQCPICLLEFETGDDLRVLPCQGQHKFHQVCVDPWLLKVSTSCPLCRKDFNPEVDIEAAESSDDDETTPTRRGSEPRVTARYLALIRRARRRDRGSESRRPSATDGTARGGPSRPREADQSGPGGY